ncbi:MAG: CotH kinase family protein, partial [Thermomicrobiales bacterium]
MRINEFVSEHASVENWPGAPSDLDASYPDWIEIYNPGPGSISLNGYALSNDSAVPGKWVFPSGITMASNTYKVVFASGFTRTSTTKPSTSFKLNTSGVLLLSKPDGAGGFTVVSQIGTTINPYPNQQLYFSYGCVNNSDPSVVGYMATITPGAANNVASTVTDFCAKPSFSVHRGFYDNPFTLQITTDTLGSTIVYTVNGSAPSATNGTQVPAANSSVAPVASINITQSTIIRACTIKSGLGNSDGITNTYIYWNDVVNQTGPLASMGLTPAQIANWGSSGQNIRTPSGPDWAVDPNITDASADSESRFTYDDLKKVPAVSLVTNFRDMFGPSTVGVTPKDGGIYIGPEVGVPTEGDDRDATLEYFNPDGDPINPNTKSGFQSHGKVHVFGGTSDGRWKSYKLSMHFKADRNEKYNVYGTGIEDDQQDFVLDAQSNNSWDHPDAVQRTRGEYIRDQVTSDLQNQMGGWSQHGRPVHLFIEGMYWGMYILHEQPNEQFNASYYGGDSDDWDVFKHGIANTGDYVNTGVIDPSKAISSTNSTVNANYETLLDLVGIGRTLPNPTPDLTLQANYDAVWTKLDRDAYIKYMALNFFAANTDWSQHNFYASYNRVDPAAKWRFQSWDAEHVFEQAADNILTKGSFTAASPEDINAQLRSIPEYRLAFADAIHQLMFNDGILSVANVQAVFTARLDQTDSAIRGESARWGDNRRTPAYTRGVEWLAEKNRILNTIIPQKWT